MIYPTAISFPASQKERMQFQNVIDLAVIRNNFYIAFYERISLIKCELDSLFGPVVISLKLMCEVSISGIYDSLSHNFYLGWKTSTTVSIWLVRSGTMKIYLAWIIFCSTRCFVLVRTLFPLLFQHANAFSFISLLVVDCCVFSLISDLVNPNEDKYSLKIINTAIPRALALYMHVDTMKYQGKVVRFELFALIYLRLLCDCY